MNFHPAVLEAGDLASLLAQFEASEAVNTSGSDNPEPESVPAGGIKKQDPETVTTDSHQTPATGTPQHKKTSQPSPTHQNIKDALPKEIIEKIKGVSYVQYINTLVSELLLKGDRRITYSSGQNFPLLTFKVLQRTRMDG